MKKIARSIIAIMACALFISGFAAEGEIIFSGRIFKWVNPFTEDMVLPSGVHHKTFFSQSMRQDVGYAIYLPPSYEENVSQRFPVVYYLHGGRPGSESRSVQLTNLIHENILNEKTPPAIYVFINGGVISHYNYAPLNSMGEDLFVRELIPHIDSTYRSVASREGRAIQGFSQGGRGTTRIMFKHPELFSSAAAGGPGYAVEKQIYENSGVELDTRREDASSFDFGEGNDAYSLAKIYAENGVPALKIAIWIGTERFNYRATLDYMQFLDSLGIDYKSYVVGGADHNPLKLYESIGVELMNFHANSFGETGE